MSSNAVSSAYDLKPATYRPELTEVGKGTPIGELMRRYWLPIGLTSYATTLPRQIRALGEDLILFRDKQGRPGLVHPRCVHRGSSLLYGRVEDDGIRCCYHGWMFDVQGKCVDQPCEPDGGLGKDKVRQPWYPVEERYGLVWAYMGPPDKQPLLPRWEAFESVPEGEQIFTDDCNIGSGRYSREAIPFNWLQHYENVQDTAHFLWLHFFHSGAQFGSRYGEYDKLDFQPWEKLAAVKWRATPRGILNERVQPVPDGGLLHSRVETVLPNARCVPNPFGKPGPVDTVGFILPVDDTHFRIFTVLRAKDDGYFRRLETRQRDLDEKAKADPAHWQKFPGDFEAQGSQGSISLHSEERLSTSDRGIVMLRRQLQQQAEAVAAGRDPIGVAFSSGDEWVRLEAGQFFVEEEKVTPD